MTKESPFPNFWDKTHPLSPTYEKLVKELVPESGPCDTLEGELLRAAGRIYHDYCNNGFGNNWLGALRFLDDNLDIPRKTWALLKPYSRGNRTVRKATYDKNDPIMVSLDKLAANVVAEVISRNGEYRPSPCDMFHLQERQI